MTEFILGTQFDRRCYVTVTDSAGYFKQVQGYRQTGSGLHIGLRVAFRVERGLTGLANTATVRIWNMEQRSRAAIAQRSLYFSRREPVRHLQVSAGYADRVGALFNGAVTRVLNEREGADWITTIEASTAAAHLFLNTMEKSWDSLTGVPLATILAQVFAATGLGEPQYSPTAMARVSSQVVTGMAVSGSAAAAAKRILRSYGLDFTVDVDGVHIYKDGQPLSATQVFFVDEYTGLLGSPKLNDLGAEITTLLDPRVGPGALLTVDSETLLASVPGLGNRFTVWKVTHNGDTHGNAWENKIEGQFYPPVQEVTQPIGRPPTVYPPSQLPQE